MNLWNSSPQDVIMMSGLDVFKGDLWMRSPLHVTVCKTLAPELAWPTSQYLAAGGSCLDAAVGIFWPSFWPTPFDLAWCPRRFIAHAICHCYQPAWDSLQDPHAKFYLVYLLSTGSAGLACLFLCLSVDRYGRRGILLFTTTLTGIASLILLGLGNCKCAISGCESHVLGRPLSLLGHTRCWNADLLGCFQRCTSRRWSLMVRNKHVLTCLLCQHILALQQCCKPDPLFKKVFKYFN